MTRVARFEIGYTQFVDPAGKPVGPLPEFAREPKALLPLYRGMVLTRRFDAKAIALQRTGQLGTYASSLGQEAVDGRRRLAPCAPTTCCCRPIARPARSSCAASALLELLLYWGGDERGSDFAGPARRISRSASRSPAHCLHAAGVAYAMKLRREPRGRGLRARRRRAPPRAISTKRSTPPAPGSCRWSSSSPTTSGRSRCRAARRRAAADARAEGDRGRHPGRAGRRQRRHRGAPRRGRGASSARAAAGRR